MLEQRSSTQLAAVCQFSTVGTVSSLSWGHSVLVYGDCSPSAPRFDPPQPSGIGLLHTLAVRRYSGAFFFKSLLRFCHQQATRGTAAQRVFPLFGTVNWTLRRLRSADQQFVEPEWHQRKIPFLPNSDAQLELRRLVLTFSARLNAPSCPHLRQHAVEGANEVAGLSALL